MSTSELSTPGTAVTSFTQFSHAVYLLRVGGGRKRWIVASLIGLFIFNVAVAAGFRALEMPVEMRAARSSRFEAKRLGRLMAVAEPRDVEYLEYLYRASTSVDTRCGLCAEGADVLAAFHNAMMGSAGNATTDVSSATITAALGEICVGEDDHCAWRFVGSAYFAFTCWTTIGYGNFAPATPGGKCLVVFTTFFGMVIAFGLFGVIGERILGEVRRLRGLSDHPGAVLACAFLAYLAAGAAFFYGFDLLQGDSTFLQAAYFCFVAVSTLGLGDVLPRTAAFPLLATFVYTVLGIALASASVYAVSEPSADADDIAPRRSNVGKFNLHSPASPRTPPDPAGRDDRDSDGSRRPLSEGSDDDGDGVP